MRCNPTGSLQHRHRLRYKVRCFHWRYHRRQRQRQSFGLPAESIRPLLPALIRHPRLVRRFSRSLQGLSSSRRAFKNIANRMIANRRYGSTNSGNNDTVRRHAAQTVTPHSDDESLGLILHCPCVKPMTHQWLLRFALRARDGRQRSLPAASLLVRRIVGSTRAMDIASARHLLGGICGGLCVPALTERAESSGSYLRFPVCLDLSCRRILGWFPAGSSFRPAFT